MARDPSSLALSVVNNVSSQPVDLATLLAAIADPEVARRWAGPLSAFFCQLPTPAVIRFLHDFAVSRGVAKASYQCVKDITGEHNGRVERWLDER